METKIMATDFTKFLKKNPSKILKDLKAKPQTNTLVKKRREQMIAGLTRTIDQISKGVAVPSRGWYQVLKDGAETKVTVRAGNRMMEIGGNKENIVDWKDAGPFYKAILAEVQAENMDEAIAKAYAENTRKPNSKK